METNETPKAAEAFLQYCAMGTARSLAKLAAVNGRNTAYVRQLEKWSSDYKWVERAKQYDIERAEARRLKHDAEIEEMNARHAEMGMDLQERAQAQIKKLIDAKAFGSMASVQMLKMGTDLERLARGEPTEHTELTGKDGGPVAIVTKWANTAKSGDDGA